MKNILLAILLLGIWSEGNTQAVFSNRNDLLTLKDMHSAVPVAVADMNGDGLDDIIAMDRGRHLTIQYQTPDPARPFVVYSTRIQVANGEQNDIIIADFNNDGANDIFTIGSYDRVKVLYGIPHSYELNHTIMFVVPFFSQGASAGDFNGDGWVDIVALNDNGLNYTLLNDGAGGFIVSDYFDFVTTPPSDNSGNYGSVYTDFDMDGDVDFYIAKCRQGVNNPNDPRRINALFVNDGNNNYSEQARDFGLASGRQSWTADFGDIDNDGDLDVLMTQHDVISEIFENIGNDTFVDITSSSGLNIGGIPLQGMFRDFDNDGFQDILVSGDRVDYYHNNGDNTFTRMMPFGNVIFGTFALGDLNGDGFTDVYASRVIPFNNPDLARPDILFLNEGNENHFISLRLKDTLNNTSAIGAAALLYGSWGIQVREVRAGEQYGVSNSHHMIFGLGKETMYDSLVIRWPDGTRETYNDLSVDVHHIIFKGGCHHVPTEFWPGIQAICGNDSIILKSGGLFSDLLWSTGETSDSIIIKNTGLYYLSYRDADSCSKISLPMEVIVNPDTIRPVLIYEGETVLCNNDVAVITTTPGLGYEWSNGEMDVTIEVSESGEYFVEVQGYCIPLVSDTVLLQFIVPTSPVTQGDTFHEGESVMLIASGDSIVWYDDPYRTNVLGYGNVLILEDLDLTTIVYAENLGILEGRDYQLGPIGHQGTTKYNASFVNGGLLFDVLSPVILNSFTLYTDFEGVRIIEFTRNDGFYYAHETFIDSGMNIVDLDLALDPGSYTVSTNADNNVAVFGDNSPLLWRSPEGISYPYFIKNVLSITNSTFGEQYYYYFYDWNISSQDRYCGSDLVAVTAYLDPDVVTSAPALDEEFMVYPNPTRGVLHFSSLLESGEIEVLNSAGEVIMKKEFSDHGKMMDLRTFPQGLYFIKINSGRNILTRRVFKL